MSQFQFTASMMENPLCLPVVTIQPSFSEIIQEVYDGIVPSEKFWVSCYKNSQPSVHAKVNVELDEIDRNLVLTRTVDGDVEVTRNLQGAYSVECRSLGISPTRIVTPVQEYREDERANPSSPHRITAFAVSPDSSRFATAYMDGSVLLHPTSSLPTASPSSIIPHRVNVTASKVICKSHQSVVSSLKFFPSSRVILSSGQDFSLSVIPADLPETFSYQARVVPARVMRGHTGSVTDTAIIGVGRNVLSSSLDKKVRLWDISSGDAITTLFANGPVTAMCLGDRISTPPDGEEIIAPPSGDSREVPETSSKVVFCALKTGSFQVFDLGFKKSIYTSPASSSLTSITYSQSSTLLATGSSSGVVTLYDARSLSTPLTSFSRMKTEVEDIAFLSQKNGSGSISLALVTSDGLPYVASVVPEGPTVCAELVGADCDPVRHVTARDGRNWTDIWSASDDGVVRRYIL